MHCTHPRFRDGTPSLPLGKPIQLIPDNKQVSLPMLNVRINLCMHSKKMCIQKTVPTLQTAALMSEDSPARVSVAEGTDTQDAPAFFFSRPRLSASDTQQDAARRSLLNLARLRGFSPLPRFHGDGSYWKEEEGCGGGEGGDRSDFNSGTPARGEKGGLGDRGLESGSGQADLRIRDGEGRRGVTARGLTESRESGCYGDRNPFRAGE